MRRWWVDGVVVGWVGMVGWRVGGGALTTNGVSVASVVTSCDREVLTLTERNLLTHAHAGVCDR